MAGTFGSVFGTRQAQHARKRHWSLFVSRGHRPARRLGITGAVIAACAAIAIAMLPLAATPASAQPPWTVTLGAPTGGTTTGFVANGTVTPNGDAGFAYIVYEPTGTSLTSSSPTAGCVFENGGWVCVGDLIFSAGITTPQTVSIAVGQLTPNTSYTYELQAEDDNGSTYDSSTGTFTTSALPTGQTKPIIPPSNPSANGIFGQCSGDTVCVNDMNGVRAAQENLPPLALPSNWASLSGIEQMFVWTNLERASRGEATIPNLVNTYSGAIQTGLNNNADPDLSGVPGNSGSIWAGSYATPLGAMYAWLYDDGYGGENGDCTSPTAPGCWGHRDNILSDPANFGGNNPTEMDAGDGTDSGGSVDYDAIFDTNSDAPPPGNIVFTWAEEEALIGGSSPSISGVTLSGTPAAPTVTVTGSNFGSAPTTGTPETCQAGDTGDDYSASGLIFQDLNEGWGAGEPGDCIGLLVTSWSTTKVVFTVGNEYANYGPIQAGDQIEVTILGASDTVTASFPTTSTFTNPTNAETGVVTPASFTWTATAGAQGYWLNIGTTPGSQNLVSVGTASNVTSYSVPALPPGTTLYAQLYTEEGGSYGTPQSISFTTAG